MKVIIIWYFIIINIVTFYIFWNDKRRARKRKWRIPENTLIGIAAIGGGIGAIVAMNLFHHKTKKMKFKMIYIFIPLHICVIGWLKIFEII